MPFVLVFAIAPYSAALSPQPHIPKTREYAHFWYTSSLFSAIPYFAKIRIVDNTQPSLYLSIRKSLFFHFVEIGTCHAVFTTLGLPKISAGPASGTDQICSAEPDPISCSNALLTF
jgi:hypothetical protein